ncbi:MAG: amino acid adenylation domain-containing protein [Cyanobacteria bacterium J06623_7]
MAQKNIQDIYPLSPMQQGMLFHSLLEPDSGAYIIQTCYELYGQINVTAFAKSWQQLLARHAILRTAFVWDNLEQPLQVVGAAAKVSLIEHNWQQVPTSEQPHRLASFCHELRTTGFNLNRAPLMRLDLIEMRSHYQFVWTYHHLLLDGWSVPLLIKELLGYYQSFSQGLNTALAPAVPYKNYIAWLKQQNKEVALDFWRQELKGISAPTNLAIGQNRNSLSNSAASYQQCDFLLSAETTYKLEFLAREYQTTLNTIVQAAWGILLHRYSGDREPIFGATTSGRPANLANAQMMVGLFINTLPVRVQIDSAQLLTDWLQQLQSKQTARQEHEYISLIDIHRVSDFPQDTALFQSIVVFENYPVESRLKQSLDVLDIRNIQTSEQTNYPLTLYAAVNSQLSFKLLYNSQLFDRQLINNFLQHLKTLLINIASNPQQRVGELDILTASEKEQLLTRADSTTKDKMPFCWHQLFENRVKEQEIRGVEEKIALITDDESLTYSELNDRANQLAHYLQGKLHQHQQTSNLAGKSLVGVYLDRDSSLVVTLLAILKAGAAYVPLDPRYPSERLNYIINHGNISYIITRQDIEPKILNCDHTLSVINLEGEREAIQQQSKSNLELKISPQALAYVLYTSGSTGKPKGVAVQHKSLVNFLNAMKEKPGINESDRLLAVTTISFDIAALEIYLPLLVGATVVLAPADIINSELNLAARLERHQITMMQATPITWSMLLADNWQGNKQLKILSGGEALKPQLAQGLLTKGKSVWNLYGPTETTIWSSIYQVQADSDRHTTTVPIGKPIDNTQFYLLDSQLRLVPPGATGELYIGGAGLARGYLNQPDLTAEKFIPNPFAVNSSSPVSLLYKTGDRVRQLPSGDIEYLGRLDNQVKISGYRIELGEIEALLNQHAQVQTSVVLAQRDRLTTYIISNSSAPPTPDDLRQFLTAKLPSYMIPSSYTALDQFPLTPNGKIDRTALAKLNRLPANSITAYKQPQSTMERAIAEIWQQVLQVERVGLTDNFFDLGGQSLLMIRVHSLLRDKLGVNISLVDMFRYPTVTSLVEYCQVNGKGDRSNSSPEISEASDRERVNAGKNRLQARRKKRQT